MAKIARFEDLQSWQKGRQLANYVYDLTEHPKFAKTSVCAVKFRMRLVRLCTTLPRGLTRAQTLNSFASSKCCGVQQAKCNPNSILRLIANTSVRMS